MDGLVLLIYGLVPATLLLGLVCWVVLASDRSTRLRRGAYRRKAAAVSGWATAHGWAYRDSDPALLGRFKGEPFALTIPLRAQHVLYGRHRGHDVVGFEYESTTRGNVANHRFHHIVVVIPTPAVRPYLEVMAEDPVANRLLEVAGVRDLQLESEEFNRAFLITAGDDKFAYDVLHPRMMEWLLADPRARNTPFRFEAGTVLCWAQAELDPRYIIGMADYLADVLERVPAFVWK